MKKRKRRAAEPVVAQCPGVAEEPAPPSRRRKEHKSFRNRQLPADGRLSPQPSSRDGPAPAPARATVPAKPQAPPPAPGAPQAPLVAGTPPGGGLSSNWLQLQKVLGKPRGRRPTPAAGQTGHEASADREKEASPDAAGGPLPADGAAGSTTRPLSGNQSVTQVLAMDCEMVGVGYSGSRSVLARVCLINSHGTVLLDKHVRPIEDVTDYRTHVSGVRARDLSHSRAEDFWEVQKEVARLLKGRILVGHALHNDLKALLLSHPKRSIRDTLRYRALRSKVGRGRALRHLARDLLGVNIQEGEHSPVDDARAALYLYLKFRKEWEQSLLPRSRCQLVEETRGAHTFHTSEQVGQNGNPARLQPG